MWIVNTVYDQIREFGMCTWAMSGLLNMPSCEIGCFFVISTSLLDSVAMRVELQAMS